MIGFAHYSPLKLDKSGKTQISPSKPWQENQRKKGLNWKKRTASDLTAPQRSLTASRGLLRISAPSRLGLQLAQSHHHPGAQRPRSETDQDYILHDCAEYTPGLSSMPFNTPREALILDLLTIQIKEKKV